MDFLKFADNIVKEAGKVLNDVGSATSEALNEASKFTGEVITESVKTIGEVSSQVGNVVSEKAVGVAGDVAHQITNVTSETFNEAGKIANNTKEQIESVDLFNSKLRQEAVDGYNEAISCYNEEADSLANKSIELYQVRDKAIKVVKIVEERINKLANKPKEFETKLEAIDVEIQNFEDKQIAISQSIKEAELASGSTAATASLSALGVTVATLGPTAAMGVATTFGVASTGTAISSLSGAAANSAALAWLGGGSVAAGGGGVAAGNAFLALAGPVGWGIAGAMLTASIGAGVVANRKNEEVAKEAMEEQKKVELLARQLKEKVIEVTELIELTEKQTEGIYLANLSLTGMDYSLFTEDEKYQAGALVNSTLSLTAMVNKEIRINE
ncbi:MULTISPECIES: hypothetical protein [Streptococcus]|jgi:hypothetical protein|uniref:Uncharacterized protein n=1 Tax=Streptococcus oralis TaxID=1303 RepID=A0A139MCI8_STROR|nr:MULTISPECIES: hypothetical protein [Streptococcus]RSI89374.1 hypothetical protein D8851_07050 [Streptococcus mitis]KXT61373.1 hypothetical protein SORDD05_00319 [Streptococcus oralis]MCY7090758.1 hypothetical protein [Streptococcus oralis]ORO81570.1 hypothetical protein B7706_07670 [Streptococcus oralis subsp. dentisani]ORO82150.1 hypothetical protein B7704_06980 [Streptococcus oralis subsp. dentisani]